MKQQETDWIRTDSHLPKDGEEVALFVPLCTAPFRRFQRREKDTEYRPYGARWNERICYIGRPVILSRGYGKHERLSARVAGFTRSQEPSLTPEWEAHYGQGECEVACIKMDVLPEAPNVK